MNISRDPKHDALAATYQAIEGSFLNEILCEHGIKDPEKRRAIVAEFLFQQGSILDQFWFKHEGEKFYPGLFFGTRPHEAIEEGLVHLPSEELGSNLHEYAQGAADQAVDETVGDIEIGNEFGSSAELGELDEGP